MQSSADAVFALLPSLSAEQLALVRDKSLVLINVGPKAPAQGPGKARPGRGDEFARDLYEAIGEVVKHRTQVRQEPWVTFSLSARFAKHFAPAARLAAEANAVWFPKQTRAERASMVRLYAELSLDYLAGQEREAVWFNIAAAVRSLPEVVDRAFPGYAACGLLGKVQSIRARGSARV